MALPSASNINKLLKSWPVGTVATSTWLEEQGVSRQLAQTYKKGSWIKHLGSGAWVRDSDTLNWQGAVYALQSQLDLAIHVGGKSALEISGINHFVSFREQEVFLFGSRESQLPLWFKKAKWGTNVSLFKKSLFTKQSEIGIDTKQFNSFTLRVSSRERAILEVLALIPKHQDYAEARALFESLRSLRPELVQKLLQACTSIQVKRLFLHLAEATNQPWFNSLNFKKIKLGKGKRKIGAGGVFDSKYNISVPKLSNAESLQGLEGP